MSCAYCRALRLPLGLGALILLALFWATGRFTGGGPDPEGAAATAVGEALGGEAGDGYARAMEPRPFRFPADHGPHPDFRNEWWYVTGNLEAADGGRFGYQFTLFRVALAPPDRAPPADSAWRTRQVYMAHFAITDVAGGEHQAFERFARGAVALAGAQADPFDAWLGDWSLAAAEPRSGDGLFPLRLTAAAGDLALELTLETDRDPVLQGEAGLSQKSAAPGNASYYYSYTRLTTRGHVTRGDRQIPVTGASWLDREWSTSALGPDQSGWDWLALQLADGRDVMVYRMRRQDGRRDPHSRATVVAADGSYRVLPMEAFRMRPTGWWQSPDTGERYPAGWDLEIPGQGLALTVTPVLADQEMDLSVRYWEGAVDVTGRDAHGPVTGRGYLEMTRYGAD